MALICRVINRVEIGVQAEKPCYCTKVYLGENKIMAVLYSSASETNLNKVDVMETSALRIACGALRTFPRYH